jgi:hypothetical protein
MTRKPTWVDGRVNALLAVMHDLGMSVSRGAAELIQERVRWMSAQMGISPTAARCYLTDDALADLARATVNSVADETPPPTWQNRTAPPRYRCRSSAAASRAWPRPSTSGFANSTTSATCGPSLRSRPRRCPRSARSAPISDRTGQVAPRPCADDARRDWSIVSPLSGDRRGPGQ